MTEADRPGAQRGPTEIGSAWVCPRCRKRFGLRMYEEHPDFVARCRSHEGGVYCEAACLARVLQASGMELMTTGAEFVPGYSVLKEAELTQMHRTRLLEPDGAMLEAWGPRWAVRYDAMLCRRQTTYARRVVALREAAQDPERALAFLVLAGER